MAPSGSWSLATISHKRLQRVVNRAAEIAGMQVLLLTAQFQLDAERAAQRFGDRGPARSQHRMSDMTAASACQASIVPGQEIAQVGTADLLLAFEQAFHVDWQRARRAQPAFERLDVDEHLPLVVGSAAAIETAVAQRRLERRRCPFVERLGRLDVVVAVDQKCRGARRMQPVRRDDRMASRASDPHVLQADHAQVVGQPRRASPQILGVPRLRADAGKADERRKLRDEARLRGPRLRRSRRGRGPAAGGLRRANPPALPEADRPWATYAEAIATCSASPPPP